MKQNTDSRPSKNKIQSVSVKKKGQYENELVEPTRLIISSKERSTKLETEPIVIKKQTILNV